MGDVYLIGRGNIESPKRLPVFEYKFVSPIGTVSHPYKLKDIGIFNGVREWRIDFKSQGTFTPAYDMKCDVAVVYKITDQVNDRSRRSVDLKAGTPVNVLPKCLGPGSVPYFGDIRFPNYLTNQEEGWLCLVTSK